MYIPPLPWHGVEETERRINQQFDHPSTSDFAELNCIFEFWCKNDFQDCNYLKEQGRIHGNTVADDLAGAVMQKPIEIQKCDGPTDRRTDRPSEVARD